MRTLTKSFVAVTAAAAMCATYVGVAVADNIVISGPSTVSAAQNSDVTFTAFLEATSGGTDVQNCNVNPGTGNDGNAATLSFSSSNTAVADAPASVQVTDCDDASTAAIEGGVLVSVHVKGTAPVNSSTVITVSGTGGKVTGNRTSQYAGDTLTINVTGVQNQAPLYVVAPTSMVYDTTASLSTTGGSGTGAVTYAATGPCSVAGAVLTMTSGTGTCSVTATKAGDASYNPVTSSAVSVAALKAAQTITFAQPDAVTYGGAPFAVSASASSGLPVTITSTTTSVCTIDSGTVTIVSAGTCTLKAVQAGNDDYSAATDVSRDVTVNKASQTVSLALSRNTATYGDGITTTITASASSGLPVALGASGPCSISGTTLNVTGAGTCTVTGDQAGNVNYAAATQQTATLNIAKANQTITFAQPSSKTFGDAAFAVAPTASSGLAVSLAAAPASVCTVSGLTVTIVGAGDCTLTASQGGDDNYNSAPDVSRTFTVNKAAQSITFDALADKTFGDADFDLTATASSGLPVAFASTTPGVCTVAGSTVSIEHAGTCSITASQSGNGNWLAAENVTQSFTVNKAAQTITFGSLADKTYGDADFDLTATASSGLTVAFASTTSGVCTVAGSTVTILHAGTCSITASQGGNGDYLAATDVPQSFTVNKAAQTITFGSLADKTYGDAPFSVSATSTSNLPVSFASTTTGVCTVAGSTVTILHAGTCSITASQGGNGDYLAATDVPQSFTVNKAAQAITFGSLADKTYGDAPFSVSATASSDLPVSFASSTAGVCTVSGAQVTIVGAGTCSITASQAGNGDYLAADDVTRSFTVAKAPLTVTASSHAVKKGDPVPTVTGTYGGFVNGDDAGDLTGTLVCSTAYTPSAEVGSYATSCSGVSSDNYAITFVNGTVTVTYAWSGFFQPIDAAPNNSNGKDSSVIAGTVFNKAKAGSVIPVKFDLGGNQGMDIFAPNSPGTYTLTSCGGSVATDAIEELAATNASGLKYDASVAPYGQYNWAFKSSTGWAGKCVRLNVKLKDGTDHYAFFNFTK